MAGLGPFGFGGPIGTIGPRGMDVSPWFQTQQLQLQRQRDWQDQLAQQQQMQQFQQQLGLSQAAQDFNRKIAELELQQSGARDAFNQRQRVSELQAAELEDEEEDKSRAERDKVSDLRALDTKAMAQREYDLAVAEEHRRADEEGRRRETWTLAKAEAEEAKTKAKMRDTTAAAVASVWAKNPSLESRLRQGTLDARDAQLMIELAVQAGADPAQAAGVVQQFLKDKRAEDMDRRAFELEERRIKREEEREKAAQARGARGEELDAEKNARENTKLDQMLAEDAREAARDARQEEVGTLLSMIAQARDIDPERAKALLAELDDLRKKPLDVAMPAPSKQGRGAATTQQTKKAVPAGLTALRRRINEFYDALERKDLSPEQRAQFTQDAKQLEAQLLKEYPDWNDYN